MELWVQPAWAEIEAERKQEVVCHNTGINEKLNKIFPRRAYQSRRVPVSVYRVDGTYVKTYGSEVDCARSLNVNVKSVRNALYGFRKSIAGMLVKKADIVEWDGELFVCKKNIAAYNPRKANPPKAISVYDLDGIYLETYLSMSEAAQALGVSLSQLVKVARGEGVSQAGGYQFRYARRKGEGWDKTSISIYRGRNKAKYKPTTQ